MSETSLSSLQLSDRRVYQEVFDKLFLPLCGFASKYLHATTETEDLVQDAFISLWEQRNNFDHYSAIKAFLYTTVRNKCLNALKHAGVKNKHAEALLYELQSVEFFQDRVIEEESFHQLYQEIRVLPNSARKIMLLALKGLKNKDIAAQLSISENTVKTQKKIAYARLKANLDPGIRGLLLAL